MAKNAFITPDFFSVAKELIGLPLASPSRRAFAMAIDGIFIAALVQISGIFLGLTAAFLLWRASGRGTRGGFFRESVRLGLRASAAVVLFVVVMASYNFGEEKIKSAEQAIARASDDDDDESDAAPQPPAVQDSQAPAIVPVTDSAAIDSIHSNATQILVTKLQEENKELIQERQKLRAELEEARAPRGFRDFLGGIFDDLGLGFGWAAVYFTGFLSMMRGQTPGKRFAGIRVIRLDGKPLGWWISFERFGGYAASFSVGLLGFIQILWDRNRQGLHDKACETVVVRDNPQAAARS